MFDRFTENARRAMTGARQASQRLNHDYIGTEHILLGLVEARQCTGTQVLRDLGLDPAEVERTTNASVPLGTNTVTMGQLPFTPRAKRVLELSLEEARRLEDDFIGTEHVLLGLLAEAEGIAAQVLLGLGATIGRARAQVKIHRAAEPPGAR